MICMRQKTRDLFGKDHDVLDRIYHEAFQPLYLFFWLCEALNIIHFRVLYPFSLSVRVLDLYT